MKGKKFYRWTVLESAPPIKGVPAWLCRCECGTQKVIRQSQLRCGQSKSCGCLQRETAKMQMTKHGGYKDKEYAIWSQMKGRCLYESHPEYKNYGARGITVCDRWMEYPNFLKDMGRKPTTKHTLERIDNDKGYSPENCRWASIKEQQRNKRTNRVVRYQNIKAPVVVHCERLNLSYRTVINRLWIGWDVDRALGTRTAKGYVPRSHYD